MHTPTQPLPARCCRTQLAEAAQHGSKACQRGIPEECQRGIPEECQRGIPKECQRGVPKEGQRGHSKGVPVRQCKGVAVMHILQAADVVNCLARKPSSYKHHATLEMRNILQLTHQSWRARRSKLCAFGVPNECSKPPSTAATAATLASQCTAGVKHPGTNVAVLDCGATNRKKTRR